MSRHAGLRLMVKRILRKYKYPLDMADAAAELALQQVRCWVRCGTLRHDLALCRSLPD
nr:type I restriction enzyme endonuclease domain-containing protein [Candidimonas nitroreducens]